MEVGDSQNTFVVVGGLVGLRLGVAVGVPHGTSTTPTASTFLSAGAGADSLGLMILGLVTFGLMPSFSCPCRIGRACHF